MHKAARGCSSRSAPRLAPKLAAALAVLAAFTGPAMAAAPVVLWVAWTLVARQMSEPTSRLARLLDL